MSETDPKPESNQKPESTQLSRIELDKTRRNVLLITFSILLLVAFAAYSWLHLSYRGGLLGSVSSASSSAMAYVAQASDLLASAQDTLSPDETASVKRFAASIGDLVPRLDQGQVISTTLSAINLELDRQPPRKGVLMPLFSDLENEIRPGYSFWAIGPDRWIEMAFWSLFGTLVFLLSEIKYWSTHQGSDFVKFTPWYFTNLVRGPFISLLIMFALASVAVDIVGFNFDVNQAPIEVLIFMAAILGFYSRVAAHVLDDIVAKLFKGAWEETRPQPGALTVTPVAPPEKPEISDIERIITNPPEPPDGGDGTKSENLTGK
jgi:hypothetical protein